jgi:hypothetical protein
VSPRAQGLDHCDDSFPYGIKSFRAAKAIDTIRGYWAHELVRVIGGPTENYASTVWSVVRLPLWSGTMYRLSVQLLGLSTKRVPDPSHSQRAQSQALEIERPERSAAWLAHQSGGLGVGSSNLPAPTNEIKELAKFKSCEISSGVPVGFPHDAA